MHFAGRNLSRLGTFAAALAIALLPQSAAFAGKTASKAKALASPSAPLSLDPNSTSLSPSALGYDVDNLETGRSGDRKPDLKIPDRIKLGDHTLRFDTSRKAIDTIPRVGPDAPGASVLNQHPPVDNDLPTPDYFGLTLTTPTH